MATENKITKRDNYITLRELVNQVYENPSEDKDRLCAFIDHELELLDQRAAKSKNYQQTHKASDDTMSADILKVLTDATDQMSVSDIVGKIEGATAQKVVSRLGKMFKNDMITKSVETVKTDKGSSRKTFYRAVFNTAG